MKRYIYTLAVALCTLGTATLITSCGENEYDIPSPVLSPVGAENIKGELQGDNYVISWPAKDGIKMEVAIYENGSPSGSVTVEGNKYVRENIGTNIPYTFVLKATDGKNKSLGTLHYYTREGASAVTGITMKQVDRDYGYDALVEWNAVTGQGENEIGKAESIIITVSNGTETKTETLDGKETSYTITDVKDGEEWNVTLVASNVKGKSLPSAAKLKIGKTMIGFLADYATPEDLVANGDDDEASAWLWLHENYPTAQFVPFSQIKSVGDLEKFRVLFWLRDIETDKRSDVFTFSDDVKAATPHITSWYKNGGSILLWSHAIAYIEQLGRIPNGTILGNDNSIDCGPGGYNPDVWKMAVTLHPGSKFKRDHSTHPIYKGLEVEHWDRCNVIAFKGAGWTENHNMLFFNYPAALTGIGNQEEACYSALTETYGIYPLGTWDSQIDWVSQLNVWEAQQGDTDFKGTILCIGNGGCEFSMKNADGTPDKSATPMNNSYYKNVLKLAENSLEYLKTR